MTVADNLNGLTVQPRGPVLMQEFRLLERPARQNSERNPERTAHVKGSSAYRAKTVTIDLADYAEVKEPSKIDAKTESFLRSAAGPLVVVAAAAVVAITLSLVPAPDGPVSLAGPLSGHSVLHFPR